MPNPAQCQTGPKVTWPSEKLAQCQPGSVSNWAQNQPGPVPNQLKDNPAQCQLNCPMPTWPNANPTQPKAHCQTRQKPTQPNANLAQCQSKASPAPNWCNGNPAQCQTGPKLTQPKPSNLDINLGFCSYPQPILQPVTLCIVSV